MTQNPHLHGSEQITGRPRQRWNPETRATLGSQRDLAHRQATEQTYQLEARKWLADLGNYDPLPAEIRQAVSALKTLVALHELYPSGDPRTQPQSRGMRYAAAVARALNTVHHAQQARHFRPGPA